MQTYYFVSHLRTHDFFKRSLDTGTLLGWTMLLFRRCLLVNEDLIASCGIPLELFGQKKKSPKSAWAVAIAFGCTPYLGGKTLLLKIFWFQNIEKSVWNWPETFFLLASFHSARECYTGHCGQKSHPCVLLSSER